MHRVDQCVSTGPGLPPEAWPHGVAGAPTGTRPHAVAPPNWLTLRQARRATERALLPFVETLEDLDILDAIGACAEKGKPCTYKELRHAGIAAPATLQRRLRRLLSLGAITQTNTARDRRYRLLALAEATATALHQLEHNRWAQTPPAPPPGG